MILWIAILLFIFLYLRSPIKKIIDNSKIRELLVLYNSYRKQSTVERKWKIFQEIARKRPLSDDLIGIYYYSSPSYDDFENANKIHDTYLALLETFDDNLYWMKKYLHPKYAIQDFFLLPGSIFSFLLNHGFNRVSSFLLSCLSWLTTIFISVYASELRRFIDYLLKKIIGT